MLEKCHIHNRFKESIKLFDQSDPHLTVLAQLKYQHSSNWWKALDLQTPGIYILTGGRQVGKSTSCKLLIRACLKKKSFSKQNMLYLPCDEIFDANQLTSLLRFFLDEVASKPFLLIIDEVTFVKDWDRVIKALADEGVFRQGVCLLTGSDTLILKEAAMRFPGRRGKAAQTDFHLYPLSFSDYVQLRRPKASPDTQTLSTLFEDYLLCGGYLRAINDLAEHGQVTQSTYSTYEQWIRGDFLKLKKNEEAFLVLLATLLTIGVSQISYSKLMKKVGLISKETVIDYCQFLERIDILINLQAFDQNKKKGFPRKDRKFHFTDPFIYHTIAHWLKREGHTSATVPNSTIVEACVASHCRRWSRGKIYYFKGDQGEVDVIWLQEQVVKAIEVKWGTQTRPFDFKMLKQFKRPTILTKSPPTGTIEGINTMPVYQFLYELGSLERP